MIYEHFAKPEGFVGKLAGLFMEKENQELNDWTLSFLNIQKGDHVLEIGFGSGDALRKAGAMKPQVLYGIDPSEAMVDMVLKKFSQEKHPEQVGIFQGEAGQLLHFHHSLDKVYAVNNVTFWENPIEVLSHLEGLLTENGRIALTIVSHEKEATDDTTEVLGGQMQNLLIKAGFKHVRTHFKPERPNAAVCVTGMKKDVVR